MSGNPIRAERTAAISGGIRSRLEHESSEKHVTGSAVYLDDMPEPAGVLHLYPCLSRHAYARIARLDLSRVVAAPGVRAVLTAADVPGTNDFSHGAVGDDRIFSDRLVEYAGQVIFVVAADTRAAARDAVALAEIDYEELPAILDVDAARAAGSRHLEPRQMKRGDSAAAISAAPLQLSGRVSNGGQEHFYLETQIALALPREDGDVHIHSSTQDPSAVQSIVARILGKPANCVTVEVRRLGGGFGGKETVATQFAAIAALVAHKTGRPAKIRLDRDDDMKVTGKRHEIHADYRVGFDDSGRVLGIEFDIHGACGNSLDQSVPVINRAAFHADNCYYFADFTATCHYWKTHIVSAVAFRGFGTPQGMLMVERVMDRIARFLGLDPLAVRMANLYGSDSRNTTPFGAFVGNNLLGRIVPDLVASSEYHARRREIAAFNTGSPILKKGLALMPIKYGVGFGVNFLNQGGALLHLYADGSLHINHGGVEMGQGLHTKVAQVVAEELQVDVDRIRVSATTTEKVPNTMATAASSGTDINAAAARHAAQKVRRRLTEFLCGEYSVPVEQVVFLPNHVRVGNQEMTFDELAERAYMARVSLSATGHYKSPKNDYDPVALTGRPHRYYVYGAAVAEVVIDALTGENAVTRVDILHDVGESLNPALDFGQLEGGFIQGMGWMTTEELVWDNAGHLRTHAPSTYKIPACADRPKDMRMAFVEGTGELADSVFHSKAIGEPPLCLALVVLAAMSDAVASALGPGDFVGLNAPATAENILMTLKRGRSATG
ncbi:MAG: xanthine dehydrogenase molybdopterin binding subunit [Rhodobacterales bacterium]|nr:xanthine dehydrogenase molybdopterin binding subunit [Rhodobacterales bacterium]